MAPFCTPFMSQAGLNADNWELKSGPTNQILPTSFVLVGTWSVQRRFEQLIHCSEMTYQRVSLSCSIALPGSVHWQRGLSVGLCCNGVSLLCGDQPTNRSPLLNIVLSGNRHVASVPFVRHPLVPSPSRGLPFHLMAYTSKNVASKLHFIACYGNVSKTSYRLLLHFRSCSGWALICYPH